MARESKFGQMVRYFTKNQTPREPFHLALRNGATVSDRVINNKQKCLVVACSIPKQGTIDLEQIYNDLFDKESNEKKSNNEKLLDWTKDQVESTTEEAYNDLFLFYPEQV
jgi:hypothetical protein